MKRGLLSFVLLMPLLTGAAPVDTGPVVNAINTLGLDLYHAQSAGDGNLLFSPYSIQNALAMTYAGADGDTRAEMQRVLHYPADDTVLHGGFAELAQELAQIQHDSAQMLARTITIGLNPRTPIELHVANRLFVQDGYPLRTPFLALVKDNYGAEPEPLDFIHATEQACSTINDWVKDQTKGKISNLISPGGISEKTRMVIVNAIYMLAGWKQPFKASETMARPFFVRAKDGVPAPTMRKQTVFSYKHYDGFAALALPYVGGGLQFLILLPDQRDGLPALEQKITPALLAECTKLPKSDVILYLPKFKLEPPSMALGDQLKQLGIQTAFDQPKGSANFDLMAPRKPDDYLSIGGVFHKAFLKLDEDGIEAAAATTIVMFTQSMAYRPPQPIEVRVDHPFIFAIQHVPTGECLFLGRVTDPR
ncbi:MAG TPA: serpin family protein [Opitutaceae bacterium]|jgi:serpin B|nr:serpin family protein [Opitutaceae bacterium]